MAVGQRNVVRKLKPVAVRQLPATYPNGRGANQPSGKIKVRHSHPLKSRNAARPGQQAYSSGN